jgi:uncharacterized protein DUF4041/T5orf172 domain-containing protein
MITNATTLVLGALVLVLSAALVALCARLAQLRSRYKVITDTETETRRLRAEATRDTEQLKTNAARELEILTSQIEDERKQRDALAADNDKAKATYEQLRQQVSLLEENLEDISFGAYKPHFEYDTPDNYKTALEQVADKQKAMLRGGQAVRFAVEWSVGGSRRDGERMQRQYTKLLLRAFNGECEAAIAKVAWNNASKMEERIRKALEAINELGGVMQVSIVQSYMELKLAELRLEHELEEKKRAVVEEQRRVRDQMREQERAQRELDTAKEEAEVEEARFAKALDKARVDAAKAKGEEHARLTSRILQLEEELAGARKKRERVSALAELTKAGYVYVLSNIGSFGENVFKIGMTRRLDPSDRVKELSDASVPFGFDVHAMVYSEDAPSLESAFHKRFERRNVNPLNMRKEFFRVSMDDLENFAAETGLEISFTRLAEAREYRETLARRQGQRRDIPSDATGGAARGSPT